MGPCSIAATGSWVVPSGLCFRSEKLVLCRGLATGRGRSGLRTIRMEPSGAAFPIPSILFIPSNLFLTRSIAPSGTIDRSGVGVRIVRLAPARVTPQAGWTR